MTAFEVVDEAEEYTEDRGDDTEEELIEDDEDVTKLEGSRDAATGSLVVPGVELPSITVVETLRGATALSRAELIADEAEDLLVA